MNHIDLKTQIDNQRALIRQRQERLERVKYLYPPDG